MSELKKMYLGEKHFCKLSDKMVEVKDENAELLRLNGLDYLFIGGDKKGKKSEPKKEEAKNTENASAGTSHDTLIGTTYSRIAFLQYASEGFRGKTKLTKKEVIGILEANSVDFPSDATLAILAEISIDKL